MRINPLARRFRMRLAPCVMPSKGHVYGQALPLNGRRVGRRVLPRFPWMYSGWQENDS
jgi:hypothetical protein